MKAKAFTKGTFNGRGAIFGRKASRRQEAGGSSIVAVVWKEMLRALWGKRTH